MKKVFNKLSFVLLAVTVLLFFLHWLKLLQPVEGWLIKILRPVQFVSYSAGQRFKSVTNPWFLKKNLAKENEELKSKVEELTLESAQSQSLKEENAILRAGLNFLEKQSYDFVLADIVGKGAGAIGREILILNKGKGDGVQAGYPVIFTPVNDKIKNQPEDLNGFLVGKVVEADEYTSKILLLLDDQSSVAGAILGEDEASGVVNGKDGLKMQMNWIPADKKIKEGDIIATSGLELNIPRGLLIGKIENIDFRLGDFFQKAVITPFISLDNLKIVAILIPKIAN